MSFKNKILMITGGTGSFGNAVLNRFLDSDIKEIRIFSRDEKKQDDMRKLYQSNKLKFYIGDVRDFSSVSSALGGVNYIFHAAALKQVPSCEFYPIEAVKTNILGTENVLEASILNNVDKVVCLSTDKAVYPINAMGVSKAMMEKVAISKSKNQTHTKICVTRYGNVMASRGSVIPLFINQIINNKPITITDGSMTRFMMTLNDAVDLVLFAFNMGNSGDIYIQKAPACSIKTLYQAIFELFKLKDYPVKEIGTRHGEKLYEVLMSREEIVASEEINNYYRIPPDTRSLNYDKYFDKGNQNISKAIEYTSHNTRQLNISEMKKLLLKLPYVQKSINR